MMCISHKYKRYKTNSISIAVSISALLLLGLSGLVWVVCSLTIELKKLMTFYCRISHGLLSDQPRSVAECDRCFSGICQMFRLPVEHVGYCRICQMFCDGCQVYGSNQNPEIGYCRICQMYGRNCQAEEREKPCLRTPRSKPKFAASA